MAYDPEHQIQLSTHQTIHLIEVDKWHKIEVETEEDRWLKFFKESKEIESNRIPEVFQTDIMQKAISTLRQFSEKSQARDLYKRQLEFARIALTEERSKKRLEEQLAAEHAARLLEQKARLLEQKARLTEKSARVKAEKVAALAEKQVEKAQAEKEKALRELERLRARLDAQAVKKPRAPRAKKGK